MGALPRSAGFGALPRSAGFGAVDNPFASAVRGPVTVVSPQMASNFIAAANAVKSGDVPTPQQAVNIIKAAIPPAPGFRANVPTPTKSGDKSVSTLSGLPYGFSMVNSPAHRGLNGLGATGVGIAVGAGSMASSGASLGTAIVPGVGTAVGAAVGAIIGLAAGLFGGSHPKVTPADIQQAQTWLQQYTAIAGSVVGRNFSTTAIQDMTMAEAILDPGFWGKSSSAQIEKSAVANFVNDEMPKRVNDFFTAMQNAPLGATVTMTDDSSIIGHHSTKKSVTYAFQNPGVNAPSYILGPLFAQYFYTMCTIYRTGAQCSGHLTAPIPQMYTDYIDWFRSSKPQWDTPQPNVVTGTDASVVAPTAGAVTQVPQSTIAAPIIQPPVANITPTIPVNSPVGQNTVTTSSGQPIDINALTSALTAQGATQTQAFQYALQQLQAQGVNTSSPQVQQQVAQAVANPQTAGFSWVEIALLAAVALPLVVDLFSGRKN
jgi:hypothetical protein